MPTDPTLIAWIPPEGCDVLDPTVGGGRAPWTTLIRCDQHGARWQLPGEKVCCTMAGLDLLAGDFTDALLLQYNGTPVLAGMDAGRRVLAEALGLDASGGVLMERFADYWLVHGHDPAEGLMAEASLLVDKDNPAEALALGLARHRGGRAVFTNHNGREEAT